MACLGPTISLVEMFELFVPQDFFATMHTDKSSHKRSFLRLRSFSILGGIIADTIVLNNCISAVVVYGVARNAGVVSRLGTETSKLENSYSIGLTDQSGAVYFNSGTVTAVYYDTQKSSCSDDTGNGIPKSTANMLGGSPSADIFTDWDTTIWQFKANRYPILKAFGELAVNMPSPDITVETTAGEITVSWDTLSGAEGYNIYQSVDNGIWEKVNASLITGTSHTFNQTLPNDWEVIDYVVGDKVNYTDGKVYICTQDTTTAQSPEDTDYWDEYTWEIWVYAKAVYEKRGISHESGNSTKKTLE